MGTQGPGRKRHPNREKLSAEDHALNQIAREAEARLAAKRAARAEAREIRMKELERQQKEIYQIQKKYYGLDAKWGDIEQWMEDSERYSHRPRRNLQASDEDDMSVTSRSSLRSAYYSDLSLASAPLTSKALQQSVHNGSSRPSILNCNSLPSRSQRGSVYDEGVTSGSRRSSSSRPPSEYSCYLGSGSRASSRASSARASPVVEERPDKDFAEKSGRPVSSLSAATLASLGGTSSRRGSGDTSISVDTEASIREIKDSLAEVEEKYKRSMVTNAQLDNEKSSLQYQVDTLREVLLELEEELAESRRQYDDKNKECERQKHEQGVLRFQLAEMKDALEQREALLTEIHQLELKQENSNREICDLKETIEWKDKKIGALERQKEFFDPVRSERDSLREEVARLRETLKKNGIALDSGITSNGDASLEPHVNADGPPSPPIRSTSMGKSDTEMEKKETVSVLGKCSPSGTEQDRQEVLQDAPVEIPLHLEGGDATEEHSEKDINGNTRGEVEPANDCNNFRKETNLKQPELVVTNEIDQVNDGKEMVVDDDHKSVEEEEKQHFSEVDGEANQRDVSPSGSDVFQDALEFVAQTPNAVSGLNEEVSLCVSEDHKNSQAENLNRKDEEYKAQHTLNEDNIQPEERVNVLESEAHDTNVIPNSHSENEEKDSIESPLCDHNVICSTQESCKSDSELEIYSDMEIMKPCEKMAQLEDKPPKDESGGQVVEENLNQKENVEETGSETSDTFSISVEKGSEVDKQDVDQNNAFPAPEHLLKDTLLTNVEVPLVDSDNIKILEDSESSILHKGKAISEDEAVNPNVLVEERNKEQQESCTELFTDASSLNPSPERNQENDNPQCAFLESNDAKILAQEQQNTFPDENPQELDDKMANVSEITKDIVPSETLSSEGESTQDGDETDEEENGATRSEKYTGESEMPCAPAGSTGPSLEDIRMEDSLDPSLKKGKGKNKEDCALS